MLADTVAGRGAPIQLGGSTGQRPVFQVGVGVPGPQIQMGRGTGQKPLIQMGGGRRCTLIRAASELGVHRGSGDVDAGVVDGVTDDIHHDRHMPLQVTSHYSVRPLSHFTGLCLVSSITFPFIRIRFRTVYRTGTEK